METLKKLEIIIETRDLDKVLEVLENLKVPFYQIIKEVIGKDFKGVKVTEDMKDGFKSCIISTVISEGLVNKIKVQLNEVFTKRSGLCIVYNNVEAVSEIF